MLLADDWRLVMAALSVLLLDKRLMRSSWLAICFMAVSQSHLEADRQYMSRLSGCSLRLELL